MRRLRFMPVGKLTMMQSKVPSNKRTNIWISVQQCIAYSKKDNKERFRSAGQRET